MNVYYFASDYNLGERSISDFTQEEIKELARKGAIEVYTLKDFEDAFNNEWISDLGYIRIF